jgi:hypothetical protein
VTQFEDLSRKLKELVDSMEDEPSEFLGRVLEIQQEDIAFMGALLNACRENGAHASSFMKRVQSDLILQTISGSDTPKYDVEDVVNAMLEASGMAATRAFLEGLYIGRNYVPQSS